MRAEKKARIPLLGASCLLIGIGIVFQADKLPSFRPSLFAVAVIVAGLLGMIVAARASLRVLLKLYLAAFSGIGVVVLVEVACRIMLPIPYECPSVHAGTPNTELLLVSAPDKFQAVHRYNSLGFRGEDVSIIPRDDVRIACIGDSWTEGVGAKEIEAWPTIVRQELSNRNCEVVNLGDAGSAPDQYLRILAEVAIPLQATHAVVCIIPGDLIDGPQVPAGVVARKMLGHAFTERGNLVKNTIARTFSGWTYLWDRAHGSWKPRGLYWVRWSQKRHKIMIQEVAMREGVSTTNAKRIVSERMSRVDTACMAAAREGKFNGSRIVGEVVYPNLAYRGNTKGMQLSEDELYASTEAWLDRYAQVCRDNEITPIVVFFPGSGLVSDSPSGPVSDRNLSNRPSLKNDCSISEMLGTLCRQIDVKYIDCVGVLRSSGGKERLFLRYDGHPTAKAYSLAGAYIAKELQRDVLPIENEMRSTDLD